MNKAIIKGARRASELQRLILTLGAFSIEMGNIQRQFIFAFPMGEHLFGKLLYSKDVSKWLNSLDVENERLFFESEHLEFLN